jgi:large subunit ribosomal protein LX
MEFSVSGHYQARGGAQPFSKTVEAPNAAVATERVYAELGSEHGLKRTQIDLDEPEPTAEEVPA